MSDSKIKYIEFSQRPRELCIGGRPFPVPESAVGVSVEKARYEDGIYNHMVFFVSNPHVPHVSSLIGFYTEEACNRLVNELNEYNKGGRDART